MGYKEQFQFWLEDSYFDEATKQELLAIRNDEKEIEDRFYKELAFGTGGLRGVIGAGTNRMNIYTVRKATQGLANYIKKQGGEEKGVCLRFQKNVPRVCGRGGALPCGERHQGLCVRCASAHARVILRAQRAWLYLGYRDHGEPQSAGV